MKRARKAATRAASSGNATKEKVKAASAPPEEAEVDRRGKPLPPRQRVGGIITPQ